MDFDILDTGDFVMVRASPKWQVFRCSLYAAVSTCQKWLNNNWEPVMGSWLPKADYCTGGVKTSLSAPVASEKVHAGCIRKVSDSVSQFSSYGAAKLQSSEISFASPCAPPSGHVSVRTGTWSHEGVLI